ncbi:hypothetical protein ACOSP7_021544 [Xanthoceras sorbifolium]
MHNPSGTFNRTPKLTRKQRENQSQLISKNLNFNLPIKLDDNNFIYWKTQILPVVRAFDLEDFIFGATTCPPNSQSVSTNYHMQGNFAQQQQLEHPVNYSYTHHPRMSAYIANPTTVGDHSWYVDSGATNHITLDFNNLSINSEYKEFPYSQLFPSHNGSYFPSLSQCSESTGQSSSAPICSSRLQQSSVQSSASLLSPNYAPRTYSSHPMITRSRNGIFKPKVLSYSGGSLILRLILLYFSSNLLQLYSFDVIVFSLYVIVVRYFQLLCNQI